MKTLILAAKKAHAQMVADALKLGKDDWSFVSNYHQLWGIDPRTPIIIYDTFIDQYPWPEASLGEILDSLKARGINYRGYSEKQLRAALNLG